MIFAKSPQTPIIDTDSDVQLGYVVTLNTVAGKPEDLTITVTAVNGVSKTWPLHNLEGKWTSLLGDGDPILFRVAKYWPDFAMKDGAPISLSSQPNNPVALVQITGPSKLLPPPAPKPVAPAAAPPMTKGLIMRVALAQEPGKIVYELERAGKIEARAVAAQGETIHLGWSKWEAHVDAVLAHAELHREVKEFTGTLTPMMAGAVRPGIHARLLTPGENGSPFDWISDLLRDMIGTRGIHPSTTGSATANE
jgi:hypothetical protein